MKKLCSIEEVEEQNPLFQLINENLDEQRLFSSRSSSVFSSSIIGINSHLTIDLIRN